MSPRNKVVIVTALVLVVALVVIAVLQPSSRRTRRSSVESTPAGSPLPAVSANGVVSDPIDPRYLTDLPFGKSSFWIQPWRAYLDTWPASRLLDSLGVNFNVKASEAQDVARLLHDSGFKLARIGINWDSLSYSDPAQFVDESDIRTRLTALHDYGLRPLILLDANSVGPCPAKKVMLDTVASAPASASTITLSASSAAEVVPGKTGFDAVVFASSERKHRHKHRHERGTHAKTAVKLSPAQKGERREARRKAAEAGLTALVRHGNPGILITKVNADHVATLSRPLPIALAAGEHKGTTLLYAPFGAPKLPDGQPNPAFQATLNGWLSYVATVSKFAQSIFGPGGYDLEVWNELSFGSQFLNAEHYYSSPGEESSSSKKGGEEGSSPKGEESSSSTGEEESSSSGEEESSSSGEEESSSTSEAGSSSTGEGKAQHQHHHNHHHHRRAKQGSGADNRVNKAVSKEIRQALLSETAAYVRDPAHGISPGVGVSDGFASQTPFPSGANVPAGLTALSKHLYGGAKSFPSAFHARRGNVPLNALGERDTVGPSKSAGSLTPLFVPHFQSLFPEFYLSGLQTATVVRDLAPITTHIYKTPHGRYVGAPHRSPLRVWMTEYNLNPAKATVVGPDETTPATGSSAQLTAADKAHFQAKALLRSLVAMVSKGMTREYFFHAGPGAFDLIGEGFTQALEANPGTYPGDALGGETMTGFRNMLAQFQGPGPTAEPRQLKLLSITQDGDHAQFTGDGTTAHPSLYDREVLAVFPFQSSPTRFVIPVYVMTRDLATLYEPNAPQTDIHRFDLPNETFRITLGNLPETTTPPTISAYDPLRNETTPTQLITRTSNTATIEIAATDYPRILTLNYTGK